MVNSDEQIVDEMRFKSTSVFRENFLYFISESGISIESIGNTEIGKGSLLGFLVEREVATAQKVEILFVFEEVDELLLGIALGVFVLE